MEVSSSRPESHFHVRSISLPTTSHPLSSKLHEEIEQLRHLEASSSRVTSERCITGLCGLAKVYNCVQELLQLPQLQQFLFNSRNKWVQEMQDASMRLVDMCGTTREMLLHMKENVRDLQSSLRTFKGKELSDLRSKVNTYLCLKKKMKKEIKKSIGAMKSMEYKPEGSHNTSYDHQNMGVLYEEMREVRSMTIIVFQLFLSWIIGKKQKTKASKWSLFARMLHKGSVASCEDEQMYLNTEVENVDQVISSFYSTCLSKDVEDAKILKLKDLEACIETLENGFQFLFRHLIRTRVSLLNIYVHY